VIDFLSKSGLSIPPNGPGAETLPLVKLPRQQPPAGKKLLFLVGIFLVLSGAVVGLGEYFYLPRLRARQVADRVYPRLVAFADSLEEVNTNVGDLFTLISGEEPSEPQVSFNLPELLRSWRERVAGERAKFVFYDFLFQARRDLSLISASFSEESDFGSANSVAGAKVTQLENQVTFDLRMLLEKARVCGESAAASRGQLIFLSDALPQTFPTPLAGVGTDITTLVQESEDYLVEAERTSHYYEVITDVQIELVPVTISLVDLIQSLYIAPNPTVYLGTIDNLAATLDGLAQRVEGLSDSLPSEMEQLHEDNLDVFGLFDRLLAEAEAAVSEEDFGRFDEAVAQFELELELLAAQAKTYELSFWQKTILLKEYTRFVPLFDRAEKELEKFR